MNISCSSSGASCLRWYAEIPSGPGAFDGLMVATAVLIASIDGTNIWAPLGTWFSGSPCAKVLIRNRCHLSCVGLSSGPLTLLRALYEWKNCIGLMTVGVGSYGCVYGMGLRRLLVPHAFLSAFVSVKCKDSPSWM